MVNTMTTTYMPFNTTPKYKELSVYHKNKGNHPKKHQYRCDANAIT